LLTNFDARNPHYVSPRAVLPEHGLIDEWIAYPSNTSGLSAAMAFLRLALGLRKFRFDAVIYLAPRTRTPQQVDRDLKFFRVAGINRVIGTEFLRDNGLSLDIPKPAPDVGSEADFLLNCLASEGIRAARSSTDLLLTGTEVAAMKAWMARTDYSAQPLVAVAPGSKWPSKIWPEDRYEAVVGRLIAQKGCYPVIVGGPEDRDAGERLLTKWHTGANSAGELTIRQSAALLAECDLYLGNDTGNMHLAGAVGTPCVAIFAALDWKGRFMPFGEDNTIFRRSVECEGCHTPDCFNAHKCLDLVGVDEVYEACVRTLEAK
jgi:ADP-heptose:LPS heptosyltransferase